MKFYVPLLACGFVLLGTTGCSIQHVVEKDYPQYLAKNPSEPLVNRPQSTAVYTLTPATLSHHTEFRAAAAGYANVWVVEFGKMFDESLKTAPYSSYFAASGSPLKVEFDLQKYEFKNFQTYLTMKVAASDGDQQVLNKSYEIVGRNQAGKVVTAGVFGMKNAIQQSTKSAIDSLVGQVLVDLRLERSPTARALPVDVDQPAPK